MLPTDDTSGPQRQLAAIMFADMVGFTALMQRDEKEARALRDRYRAVLMSAVERHAGRVVQHYGDGALCMFGSAVHGVRCAVEMQEELRGEPKVLVRVGLHTGDIVVDAEGAYGDGVNVASRIEALAAPGGVMISGKVFDEIKNQPAIRAVPFGAVRLKNVARPTRLFAISSEGLAVPTEEEVRAKAGLLEGREGVPDRDYQPRERGRRRARKRRIAVVGVAAVVGVIAFVGLRDRPSQALVGGLGAGLRGAVSDARPSVAVLPFSNLSPDEANEYFASGLHDEVLTQLQHVAGLRIISRSSVMEYAEDRPNVREIARNLRVTHLIEGGVQRIGNRLRVNVMLIDGRVDANVWGERYDRELDDAFAVQSDIARKVAEALAIALTFEERQAISLEPTTSAAAYRLYVRGREYGHRPGYRQEDFTAAQRVLEQAIEIDPDFALARAELSNLHGRMYWEAFDTSPERLEAQQSEAKEALRLQPDLPQTHVALGWVYYVRGEFRRALVEYETALDGLPNDAEVVARIGYARRRLGDWEGVFDAFVRATQLDPRNANLYYDLGGHSLVANRRYAQAAAAYDTALMLAPDLYDAGIKKAQTYVHWRGLLDSLRAVVTRIPAEVHLPEVDQARAELALWERDGSALLRLASQIPTPVVETQLFYMPRALYAAWGHRLVGDGDAAESAFDSARVALEPRAEARPADQRFEAPLAYAYAGLGMVDEAIRSAERIAQSPQRSGTSPADPRSDHAVARIYAQVGLAARAVPHLERLLTSKNPASVHTLRLDPLLDPVRGEPAFEQLLERYAEIVPLASQESRRP